jgi:hypothetical protein
MFESVVFGPNLYVDNLAIARASATTITVGVGACRDSTNTQDIDVDTTITIDGAVVGVNGIDTGALANNTWYRVYLIADAQGFNPVKGLISTSATPVMPYGYSLLKRVGWMKTNGSAQFLPVYISGNSKIKFYQWDTPIAVLSGGSATSFTAQSLAAGMPPQATPVYLNAAYTPALAANTASIRPTGSSAAALSCPVELKGVVNTVPIKDSMIKFLPQLATGNPSLDYVVTSSDALTLTVAGFEDYI